VESFDNRSFKLPKKSHGSLSVVCGSVLEVRLTLPHSTMVSANARWTSLPSDPKEAALLIAQANVDAPSRPCADRMVKVGDVLAAQLDHYPKLRTDEQAAGLCTCRDTFVWHASRTRFNHSTGRTSRWSSAYRPGYQAGRDSTAEGADGELRSRTLAGSAEGRTQYQMMPSKTTNSRSIEDRLRDMDKDGRNNK
jgi:hypothetical protein